MSPLRILIVEDSPIDAELVQRELKRAGIIAEVQRATNSDQLKQAFANFDPHCVLADYNLPDLNGEETLAIAKETASQTPLIFVSGTIGEEKAVELLRNGATDYVLKDRLDRLGLVIRRALEESQERDARHKAEAALRESEQRYRSLFDNSLDAIFSLGADGHFTTANVAAQHLSGYSITELQELHFLELCPEDQRELAKTVFRDALCKQCQDFDLAIVTKHNRRRDLFVTGAPVILDGQIVGVSCIARDITERKQAERALRENEQRWKFVLDAADLGAWVLNFETQNVWRSPKHDAIYGYAEPVKDWTVDTFLSHVLEEYRAEVMRDIQRVMEGASDTDVQLRIRRKDGEIRWLWIRGRVLEENVRPRQMVGIVQDITAEKTAELELLAADQRKNEFLAMLSHELRNPLAAIGNAVALGSDASAGRDSQMTAFQVIERQWRHLSRMVDDLIDVARLEKGQISLKKQPVPLKQAVQDALKALESSIKGKHHTLAIDLEDADGVLIHADPTRFDQVISNLLLNAIKYTHEGGRIEVSCTQTDTEAILRVADNGAGITSDVLPAIFGLFTQGSRKLDRSEGGLGIGLSVCHKLVELHGGTITARSEGRDKGAEFIVHWPKAVIPPLVREPERSSTSTGAKTDGEAKRVLVVDDNMDTTNILARLLKRKGYHVEVAYDGVTGMKAAHRFMPDLLLLDIGLPEMDGYELAKRLRSDGFLRQTLIAISGYAQENDRERALAAGFDFHLSKPVEFDRLIKLLGSIPTNPAKSWVFQQALSPPETDEAASGTRHRLIAVHSKGSPR